MEMIAMLGGIGSTPEMSAAAIAAGNAITMAKTVEELTAVSAGLPNMGLPKNEELILKVMIDKKVEELTNPTPFYKKTGYWIFVGVVAAAAYYHWPKIKRAVGLGAGWGSSDKYKINPGSRKGVAANPKAGWKTFDPYAKQTEAIKRIDDARWAERQAAKKARRAEKRRAKRKASR